ncbi:sigma-70 family RNA polymerase sigma factor [Belliella sp. DSM 111904]|uniref:Sigma-70 family RNA polymerase sigma factor n=1 Tax=Belliella filtrata TaxID=2923435 RepID=A0ABS9V559_9BACT|nr:sigma-70 family RNA polymerase sigma factor [Belliella filtrata]MCH7411554.1 sigma-70 family RNA polymerase sigma factor [Belliella filtrata]
MFELIKQDHPQGLSLLIDRYWSELYKKASKILPTDESEDLVQQVFIGIWKNREGLMITHVRGFLHQDLKFKVLQALRKRKVQQEHLSLMENIQFVNKTESIISEKELRMEIEDILQKLPSRTKEVFTLSRFENLSNKEIAEKLNISIRTVEKQISNALISFKRLKTNNL